MMATDPAFWTAAVVTLFFVACAFLQSRPRARRARALCLHAARAVPVIPLIVYDDEDEDEDDAHAEDSGVALRDVSYDADALSDEPTGLTSAFRLEAAGRTDRGLCRSKNEDRLLLLEKEHIFAIADGMGGHSGGALASTLAIDAVAESVAASVRPNAIEQVLDQRVPAGAAALISAVVAANDAVRRSADQDERFSDMGTTLVAARFCAKKRRLYVTHVGDSRCYRLRDGRFRQVTHDHTMRALGVTGPSAHHLSRAVGTRDQVEPDVVVLRPELGDAYVLCSDGLTNMVSDDAIAAVLSSASDVAHAADELVRIANERGGLDNVTAIVVRVLSRAA
jgi:serine/threonine protein phosphatase PrpC